MHLIQALILGVVQGLTEFFPVSSSSHLRITKWFLHIPDGEQLLYFDLVCHAGTLAALLIYLRKDIWSVLTDLRKIGLFTVALLPLVPAYFLLKPIRIAASNPTYLGYFLLLTAALLWFASGKKKVQEPSKWKSALSIGLAQTLALLPGISRSGSTISVARLCGWSWKEGARFSFLLAVPTILGGQLLESIQLFKGHSESIGAVPLICYVGGFLTSFAVGLFAVRFVFWVYEKEKVRPLALYCLAVGLLAIGIFN